MITTEQIRRLAHAQAFSRGKAIYKTYWKIEEFSVERDGEKDRILAKVQGSGDSPYEVRAVYDLVQEKIEDIDCECPAFYSYSGICKHCVAVLLEYQDYCERQQTLSEYAKKTGKKSADRLEPERYQGKAFGIPVTTERVRQKPKRKTDEEIKDLLDQRMRKRSAPIMQREVFGKIRIEPQLNLFGNKLELEFKLGQKKLYILKDIFVFAENIEESANVSYGKNLEFIHTLEAFEEPARRIVEFIMKWVQKNGSRFAEQVYYYGYGSGTVQQKLRRIPLDGYSLEAFLEAFPEKELRVQVPNGQVELWPIEEEDEKKKLILRGTEDGLEISADQQKEYEGAHTRITLQQHRICQRPRRDSVSGGLILDAIAASKNSKVFIQKEDLPAFLKEFLPDLEEDFICEKREFDETKFLISSVSFAIYLDMPQKDYVTCNLQAVYDEKTYNVLDLQEEVHARDAIREMEVQEMVSPWFNAFDPEKKLLVLAEDEDLLYAFLTEGIQKLQEAGEVFISEALKRIQIHTTPKTMVGVSLSGNLLELTMSAEDLSREELAEILSRYQKKKKFYRLKNGDFLNIDDEQIGMLSELKAGLRITEKELMQEEIILPKYRALYLDTQMKETQALPVVKNREFKSLIRNMKTVEDNDFELPVEMESILREYQKRGFLWLKTLKQNGFGGILADDMGLGKTLQVIAFLLSEYQEAKEGENCRSLIVAPASLVYNWQNEFERFAPALPVCMIVGSAEERKERIQSAGGQEVLLTSYDLLKRDISVYSGMEFQSQIIDEAQFIKNHGTQAAKAVRKIRSGCKIALTGTPVENRLSELWSIFEYLMPGFLYSYPNFRKEMELPIVQNKDEGAAQRLQKMVKPFILRRLKKDVLKDLPDKIEKNTYAQMEEEQQKLYDAHVKRLKLLLDKQSQEEFQNSKIVVLSELTKLRQICCHPGLIYEDYPKFSGKENLCMELIQNAVEGGHKILLFSQFTSMLARLEERLDQEKVSYCTLTGATTKERRIQMVKEFNENDVSVFCISLKAGGTGLNLTAADIVIHYDPWWNLAVQNQATDRAHRIGQTSVVSVYKLIAKGTIEENIVKLQEQKKELADQILSGEGMGSGSFDREELLELLGQQ